MERKINLESLEVTHCDFKVVIVSSVIMSKKETTRLTIGEGETLPNLDILNERATTIYQYVKAYNELDVPGMLAHMADTVVFDNYQNNQSTLHLEGIDKFKKQATDALAYFTERRQTILSLTHKPNTTEITVAYEAIAAMDFPNGTKEGDKIRLTGKSVFEFLPTGKISKLTDYS